MKQRQVNNITQQLIQLFQGDGLNQVVGKSRFLQRARKLDPVMLVLSMISALGS